MGFMWLAIGLIVGTCIEDKYLCVIFAFICAIIAGIKIANAQIKEEEQEEIEAGKHSFYYGYKFKK